MFESGVAELDAVETLAAATDRQATRTEADLDLIELSLHFADLHPDPATIPGHVSLPGGERGWVSGGPGCPGFAEFAAAEFGAAIGRSAGSAAVFIGQALALRHRLPRILAMVRSGHGEPWKARTIATACLALSVEAAAIVDRRVASIVDTVTPIQLDKIVKAAIQQADPDGARATAAQNAKERGVWAGRIDEHGSTTLTIRAATGDVIRLKATLRQIADALAELGNTDPLNQRMAMAVGIISDPALTHELLTIANHLTQTHTNPTTPEPDLDTEQDAEPGAEPDVEAGADAAAGEKPQDDRPTAASTGAEPEDVAGWSVADEPDWDPPHPSDPRYDNPPEPSTPEPAETADQADPGMDAAARRELAKKLSAIRQNADRHGLGATGRGRAQTTTLYVHLTDQTLLAGEGVTRVERYGPVFTTRLEELLGHDRIIVKPVIDLNDDRVSVNAYEIPDRIRERVKLIHPVEQFPYGPAETTNSTDLDHIQPYDFKDTGPPGQTSITNLTPLRRYSHRVKTLGGWKVRRLDDGALEWITKHGLRFRVDHKGTHRITGPPSVAWSPRPPWQRPASP
ncbi:DUF222 domain-containing protein [Streptomyces sp. SID13031]|uniref:DUF222 domain-containing protein n=1 Tax=Streptomyces sp. SID13031 TaxID=2706046 RepID=UPI0013C707EA|nr:DUF222 domain-containing protein [Streptomyces sp. SID13031]NEA34126.1 DUF222 domain-containing protein [Streptomyces sp. SID13031]